ncbi:hypothetical protein MY04_4985 [Flammeovirga sp. MY04]|uniref:DUF5723 family protein n=1 Tax=Flammeovirga sp. MY04 TaxID=1191459 RepID=UPI000806227D|nr:DUF5723 family protein [Flammeovirga sp. MY04]ANQ52320.1 hypothetical protein MY04_4985 [Flammeovirga sp. MY04]
MKKYLIIAFLFLGYSSFAQQVNTLFFQNDVAQSQQINPARKMDSKWVVSIPVTNIGMVAYNEFSFSDIYYEQNGQGYINQNALNNLLKPNNNTQLSGLSSEILGIYHQTDNFGFRVSVNYGLWQRVVYTDNMFDFLLRGPAAPGVLGQKQEISALIDGIGYVSVNLGSNFKVTDKLTLGVTLKFLSGTHQLKAQAEGSFMQKDNTSYDTEVDGRLTFSGYGLGEYIDEENNFSVNEMDAVESLAEVKNYGFAVDLGATYELTDKWTIESSLISLGAIRWDDRDQIKYDSDLAAINFKGINLDDIMKGNEVTSPIPSLDTLQFNNFEGEEKTDVTVMPWTFNLGTSFKFTKSTTFGALYSQTVFDKTVFPSFTLHAQQKLGRSFGIGLSYSADKQSLTNFGGMVSVGFPGFQMYFITDNLLSAAVNWEKSATANLRFGMNLKFGRSKKI